MILPRLVPETYKQCIKALSEALVVFSEKSRGWDGDAYVVVYRDDDGDMSCRVSLKGGADAEATLEITHHNRGTFELEDAARVLDVEWSKSLAYFAVNIRRLLDQEVLFLVLRNEFWFDFGRLSRQGEGSLQRVRSDFKQEWAGLLDRALLKQRYERIYGNDYVVLNRTVAPSAAYSALTSRVEELLRKRGLDHLDRFQFSRYTPWVKEHPQSISYNYLFHGPDTFFELAFHDRTDLDEPDYGGSFFITYEIGRKVSWDFRDNQIDNYSLEAVLGIKNNMPRIQERAPFLEHYIRHLEVVLHNEVVVAMLEGSFWYPMHMDIRYQHENIDEIRKGYLEAWAKREQSTK